MRPALALLFFLSLLTPALAGCLDASILEPLTDADLPPGVSTGRLTVHNGVAGLLDELPSGGVPSASLSYVGFEGPEPSLGVTSNGNIFFVALKNVLRSTDHGLTWDVVSTPVSSPATLDPYLFVDPVTDRVYSDQLYLGCSYLSWSDDHGETWTTNPAACGVPVNDHQKLASGPFVSANPASPLEGAAYESVLYYAYNQIAGGRAAVSFDGGLTWPYTAVTFQAECGGGLHGDVAVAPDGAVYIPARNCNGPIVTKSTDNGLTWTQRTVHDDVGTADHDKNPDLGIDREGNAYLAWPGADNLLYLTSSTDAGETWGPALRAAPPEVQTTTMPQLVAGDPGRIAIAYYGTEDSADAPDLVPEDALWHMYLTYSLNALDENPTFVTLQLTPDDDPIQVGPISTNTGDAPPGSRNLLDFIDMELDGEGRPYVAFADGCTLSCRLDDMTTSRDSQGVVAILQKGPSLFADVGKLAPLHAGV